MLRTIDDALWDVRHGLPSAANAPAIDASSSDTLTVSSAHLLLYGDYTRTGLDLLIVDGGDRLVIHDYFRPGRKPNLVAPDGATLDAATIDAITIGNGHDLAQAGGGGAPAAIGRVETVGGTASAIRNGVQVVLRPGELVYQGDTVQTDRGGSLAIIFIDGTTFSLSGSSRMVLNEMIYQAGATNNSSLMSLVSGSISFVAGQVAKSGDMRVDTPVATMGIRGTAVGWTQLDVTTDGPTQLAVRPEKFVVTEEPDGRTGSYEIRNKLTGALLGTVSSKTDATIIGLDASNNLTVTTLSKTQADIAAEQSIIRNIFQIIAAAPPIPVGPGQQPPQQPGPNPNPGNNGPNSQGGGSGTDQKLIPDNPNPLAGTPNASPSQQAASSTEPLTPPIAGPAPAPASTPTTVIPVVVAGGDPTPTTTTAPTPTPTPVPTLVAQTLRLDQKEIVVTDKPADGLLARGGGTATPADEVVTTAHADTGPHAGENVSVAPGANPTTIEGRYGTLGIRQDGTYAYVALQAATLHEGEIGTDTFTYSTNDGQTQTVTFRVAGHNDAPVPEADAAAADLSHASQIAATTRAAGVLGNDTDPDHDETLVLKVSAITGPESGALGVTDGASTLARGHYGTLAIASDGTYTYTPDVRAQALAGGTLVHETFAYTVADPSGATANATLDIVLTGVNDAPVAHADTANVGASGQLSVTASAGLLANDVDPDAGETAQLRVAAIAHDAQHRADIAAGGSASIDGDYGRLTLASDGSYAYAAGPGAARIAVGHTATETFTYTVVDPSGVPSTAALTLSVASTDHAPVAMRDSYGAQTGSSSHPAAEGLLANDTDADAGDPLSVSAIRAGLAGGDKAVTPSGTAVHGAYGDLTVRPDGSFDYQVGDVSALARGQTASDTFTYTVQDAPGATSTATVSFTVMGVNHAPAPPASETTSVSAGSHQPASGNLIAGGVTDADGDTLTITALHADAATPTTFMADGDYGRLVVTAATGDYTYTLWSDIADATPAQKTAVLALGDGDHPVDEFTYEVSDSFNGTGIGTLRITVDGVNDAPVASPDGNAASGTENQVVSGMLPAGSDPDGDALTYQVVDGSVTGGTVSISLDGSYSFTPSEGVTGDVGFQYVVRDPDGLLSDPQAFSIHLDPVNHAPLAAEDGNDASGTEDTTATGFLPTGYDPDGDALSYEVVEGSETGGTVSLGLDGSYSFTPDPNRNGDVGFQYVVRDPGGLVSDPQSFTIHLAAVDDPTTLTAPETATAPAGQYTTITGLSAADPDSDYISVTIDVGHGSVVIPSNGDTVSGGSYDADLNAYFGSHLTVTGSVASVDQQLAALGYLPESGFVGDDTLTITSQDAGHATVSTTITVAPPENHAPLAAEDGNAANGTEDTTATGFLPTGYDPDGDPLSYELVEGSVTGGTVSIGLDGSYSFTPDPNRNGDVGFQYVVRDPGGLASEPQSFTIHVAPVDDAPTAAIDGNEASGTEDTVATGVLPAGFDRDGDALTYELVDGSADGGVATVGPNGSWSFTPNPDVNGDVGFQYVVRDPSGATSEPQSFTIHLAPVNDLPVAAQDGNEAYGTEDQAVLGTLPTAYDPDGGTITYGLVEGSTVGGTVTVGLDGSFTFVPDHDRNGDVSFQYVADNATGESAAQTFTIHLAPVNDAPSASPSGNAASGTEDQIVSGVLPAGSDPDGDALRYEVVDDSVTGGTVSIGPDGSYSFTPYDGVTGDVGFSYLVHDPDGLASAPQAFSIHLDAVNHAPAAGIEGNEASGIEDQVATGTLPAGYDPDGDALSYELVEGSATGGTVSIGPDGSYSFTPDPDRNGDVGFQYVVRDPGGLVSDPQRFTIHLAPVNDAPTAATSGNAANGTEDTVATGVLPAGFDRDGDALTYELVTGSVTGGSVSLGPDGSYSFTPDPDRNGDVGFQYVVRDPGGLASDPQSFTIHLAPVNDAPTAATSGNAANGTEDTVATGILPAGFDRDGDALTYELVDGSATGGTVSIGPDGSYSFTPDPDRNGDVGFQYVVRDPGGLVSDPQSFTIHLAPVNDAPTAATGGNEANGTEDQVASGVLPAGFDRDGDALTYALVDGSVMGGSVSLGLDGSYSFTPDPNRAGDVGFQYVVLDPGGLASDPQSFTIHLAGVNDAPVVSGPSTGLVKEDTTFSSTGALTATDPDATAPPVWSIAGGTAAHAGAFTFRLDTLRITDATTGATNGAVLYQDLFDGNAATTASSFGSGLTYNNTLTVQGGDAVLSSTDPFSSASIGTASSDLFVNDNAILRTDRAAGTQGLKKAASFTLEGTYDLSLPTDLRSAFGIRLTDRFISTTSDHSQDNIGDDTLDLVVDRRADGHVYVEFWDRNYVNNTITTIGSVLLNDTITADQITLRLSHAAASGQITAAFDYLNHGAVVGTTTFTGLGSLFGSDTATTTDDEIWTRPGIVSYVLQQENASKVGQYGTLMVDGSGAWTYNLANQLPAVQVLSAGQTVQDAFQVVATDSAGASSDPFGVTIDVQGTNEAPRLSSDARSVTVGQQVSASDRMSGVLGNDLDSDPGDTTRLVVSKIQGTGSAVTVAAGGTSVAGLYGTLTIAPDGTYSYQAGPSGATGGSATDTFIYTALDPHGATSTSTLFVRLANEAPIPVYDQQSLTAGATFAATTRATGVLGNDRDPDAGDTATLSVASIGTSTTGTFTPVTSAGTTIAGLYGTLTIALDGTYSYVANQSFPIGFGIDSFYYYARDAHGALSYSNAGLTFQVVDHTPVAEPDAIAVQINTTKAATTRATGLLGNDTDLDQGEAAGLSVSRIQSTITAATNVPISGTTTINGSYGALTVAADGTYSYAAGAGSSGSFVDTFTYTSKDVHGLTTTGTLSVSVVNPPPAANHFPSAAFDARSVQAGATLSVTARSSGVLGNDIDVDAGDTAGLFVTGVKTAAATAYSGINTAIAGVYGTLTVHADGTYDYVAGSSLPSGQWATDFFNYSVSDSHGAVTTNVALNIQVTNTLPVTVPANAAVATGGVFTAADRASGLLGRAVDSDPGDTATLFVSSVTATTAGGSATAVPAGAAGVAIQGLYGALTVHADGTYTYAAHTGVGANFASDIFAFTTTDAHGASSASSLYVTVSDAYPQASFETRGVAVGGTVTATTRATGVLGNDIDPDTGQTATLIVSKIGAGSTATLAVPSEGITLNGTYGTLTIHQDGTYAYHETSTAGSLAIGLGAFDTFTYTARDAAGIESSTSLNFNIVAGDHIPVASNVTATAVQDGGAVAVAPMVSDPDGDALGYALVTGPAHGTAVFANGAFRYTPAAGYVGPDSFVYVANDGSSDSNAATASITVTPPPNHPPTITVTDPDPVPEDDGTGSDNVSVSIAPHVSIVDPDAGDVPQQYVAGSLAFDAAGTTGPAPGSGSLADLFTVDPASGSVTYDRAAFDYLAEGDTVRAHFVFQSASGPDTLDEGITVTVTGLNDAPRGTEGLFNEYGVGRPNSPLDLLLGSSDVDRGDVLSATNVQFALSSGSYSSMPPAGVTLDGSLVSVDPSDPAFVHLAAGQSATVDVAFDITDGRDFTSGGAQLVVYGANDRPSLDDVGLGNEVAGSSDYAGQAISSLYVDHSSDPDDGGYLTAIAVTGAGDPTQGTWQYSSDFGSTWIDITEVSDHSALVLGADDQLRFVPAEEFSGDATPLTVYGLDDTFAGAIHGTIDVTLQDGALSQASSTIGITVDPYVPPPPENTAPYLTSSNVTAVTSGELVSDLFAGLVYDPDAGASLGGIAVIHNASDHASQGDWQYSTDGGSIWNDIPGLTDAYPLTDEGALALSADTLLRFVAFDGFDGTPPALTVRAIDDTYSSGYSNNNTSVLVYAAFNGGTTPFSPDTADITASDSDLREAGADSAGRSVATRSIDTSDGTQADPSPYVYPWQKLAPVDDGGHSYVYIPVALTWSDANALAVSLGGHLATITSAGENAAVVQALGSNGNAFIGASDAGHEGQWNWVSDTGSGEGPNFWNGTYVTSGNGSVLTGGSGTVPGAYANWGHSTLAGVPDEPNNFGNENVSEINQNGFWNDIPDTRVVQEGFVLEFDAPSASSPTLYFNATNYGYAVLSASSGLSLTYALQNDGEANVLAAGQVVTDTVTPPLVDQNGNSVTHPVVFTITGANDAPVGGIGPQYVDPDSSFALDLNGAFYDVDQGDRLTFSVQDLPSWVAFDPSTGILSGVPSVADFGAHTVQATATDSLGASTTVSFAIVVDTAPAVAAAANLAQDPSFEQASPGTYSAEGGFSNWSVGDQQGSSGAGVTVRTGGLVDGDQFVDLHTTGSISQALFTSPGETYLVSFQLGSDIYPFGGHQVAVSVDGGPAATYGISGYVYQNWTHETFAFTASSDFTVLTFQSLGYDPFIDAVAITPTTTATELSGHHVAADGIAYSDADGSVDSHAGGPVSLDRTAITYLAANGAAWDPSSITNAQVATLVAGFHTGEAHDDGNGPGILDYSFDVQDTDLGFLAPGETIVLPFDVQIVDAYGRTVHASVPITLHGPDSGSGPAAASDTVLSPFPTNIPTEALLFNDGDGSHTDLSITAVSTGAMLDAAQALVEPSGSGGTAFSYKATASDGTSTVATFDLTATGDSSGDLTAPNGGAILIAVPSAPGDVGPSLTGGAGTDVFVLPYDSTGGSKATGSLYQLHGFDSAHDAIDLHDLTATGTSQIQDYVSITLDGVGGAILTVSRDGAEPFQKQAHIDDVSPDQAFNVIWDHHIAQVTAHYLV